MFGLGKAPILLTTREIEACLNDLFNSTNENDEVWLITPYATMSKLSSQRRSIAEAAKRKAKISFVVRNEEDQVKPLIEDLSEAISYGLKAYSFDRLHAKIYWFENNGCIFTSANLIDGSFELSTEIGLFIDAGNILHNDIREWIKNVIEPDIKVLGKLKKTLNLHNNAEGGYCIRCRKSIEFDSSKPYCMEHYKSWGKYSNFDYTEKYCHKCGREHESSMKRPLCISCFKQYSK